MFQLLNKIRWIDIIVVGFLLSILVFILILFYSDHRQKQEIDAIPDTLQVKVSKDKIISFAQSPDQNNSSETVVQYVYATANKAPVEEYQGLPEDISKRTPYSQSFLKERKKIGNDEIEETYVGKFFTGPSFYQSEGDNWYYTEVATTTKTAFLLQTENTPLDYVKNIFGQPVFAATDTTYSGAGDGFVQMSDFLWANSHSATDGLAFDYTSTYITIRSEVDTGFFQTDPIYRGFLPFDTSVIADDATISAATLNIRPYTKANTDNDGLDFITVVQTTQASNTSLVLADFDQCGAVSNPTEGIDTGERKDITSISTVAYLTFNLNATGLDWISKTGYTNLGLREGHDALNSVMADDTSNLVHFYSSEQAGTSEDPYLSVTYSIIYDSRLKIDGGRLKIDGGRLKID